MPGGRPFQSRARPASMDILAIRPVPEIQSCRAWCANLVSWKKTRGKDVNRASSLWPAAVYVDRVPGKGKDCAGVPCSPRLLPSGHEPRTQRPWGRIQAANGGIGVIARRTKGTAFPTWPSRRRRGEANLQSPLESQDQASDRVPERVGPVCLCKYLSAPPGSSDTTRHHRHLFCDHGLAGSLA